MITFIAQHQFWTAVAGYWILSAAVSLLPEASPWRACASRPDLAANSSPPYLWLYRFLHTIAGNITTALGSKILGDNAAITVAASTFLGLLDSHAVPHFLLGTHRTT